MAEFEPPVEREIVEFGGWRCARIVSGDVELFVSLDIGPRILRLGFIGGPNEFVEKPEFFGKKGGEEYRSYGGHRLWIAPEIPDRTHQPDNEPVEYLTNPYWHIFLQPVEKTGVQKAFWIRPLDDGAFWVEARLINHTPYTLDLASWQITQMAGGGTAYFPMPEFQAHTEEVLPVAPLALWGYTNLSDPRIKFSPKLASVKQVAGEKPTKLGMFVKQSWAAYANHGNLFVKTFSSETGWWPPLAYPDHGVNFELFTNDRFLELESLGPMVNLEPDSQVIHYEGWKLFRDVVVPEAMGEAAVFLAEKASETPEPLWLVGSGANEDIDDCREWDGKPWPVEDEEDEDEEELDAD